jgi:hypothetical protein
LRISERLESVYSQDSSSYSVIELTLEFCGIAISAKMAFSSEGDGGLSKLNIGGGKPKSKVGSGDGGGTNWDPQGDLIARPQRPKK